MVLLLLLALLAVASQCGLAKLTLLKPLRCAGKLVSGGREFQATYFSRAAGLEVISNDDDDDDEDDDDEDAGGKESTVRLCDVLPLPLFELKAGTGAINNQFTHSLLNRDGGLYDNLPYASWFPAQPLAKKALYDQCSQLQLSQSSQPPEASFLRALETALGLRLTGLLIEVADELTATSVTLGAAALIARPAPGASGGGGGNECAEWDLARGGEEVLRRAQAQGRNTGAAAADGGGGASQGCLVPLHKDELVALALHTQLPVCIDRALFLALATDADLDRGGAGAGAAGGDASVIRAAYSSPRKAAPAPAASSSQGQGRGSGPGQAGPAAWEIFSPQQFMRMDSLEKRQILRNSGVTDLPRPRQGAGALDRALLAVMDDAVRREVLRLSGDGDGGGGGQGAGMRIGARRRRGGAGPGGEALTPAEAGSGRAALLQGIAAALDRGDTVEAQRLREDFALRTRLRADPTQAEGSYSPFLDGDLWYAQARARAMAPKKTTPPPPSPPTPPPMPF